MRSINASPEMRIICPGFPPIALAGLHAIV
jgi:hypothetical protein